MDTSEQYIEMCKKAVEIQDVFFTSEIEYRKLLPSFVFSQRMQRIAIVVWTPKILQEYIGDCPGDSISINIEQDKELNQEFPADDEPYRDSAIWLPRQDQLQAIINPAPAPIAIASQVASFETFCMELFEDLEGWANKFSDQLSHEALWLAYVMKIEFNKVWDGKDWHET